MFRRLRWAVANFEEACCAAMLAAMSVLAIVNVAARYLTNFSLAYTEEVEVGLLVWITMLGGAAGFKHGAHLGLTFLVERMPARARRVLASAGAALGIGLYLALIWFSLRQIQDETAMGTTSEALGIPQWIYTVALPVGGAILIARTAQAAARALRPPARA
jgi:TRAP-type C4-dicarboxylate transport system permease small subunit